MTSFDRRSFLGLSAAAVSTLALGACGGRGSTAGGGADKGLPMPNVQTPPPIPGAKVSSIAGVPDAVLKLPSPLTKSVANPPGTGGTVRMLNITWGPAPKTIGQGNKYWAELNKRLNVTLDTTVVPAAAYGTKLETSLASGDMPELVMLESTNRGKNIRKQLPLGPFHDLRKFIGGDKVKDYPNLAARPEYGWTNSAIDGALYLVPSVRSPIANGTALIRLDWAKQAGFSEPNKGNKFLIPKSADELKTFLTELQKVGGKGVYAINTMSALFTFCGQQVFGVPWDWRVKDGKWTGAIETDEMEQALKFANGLWNAGLVHPDAITLDAQPKAREMYAAGGVALFVEPHGNSYGSGGTMARLKAQNPKGESALIVPPKHDGSGVGLIWMEPGYYGGLAIASSVKDEDRVKELLRIIDYACAPFGSEEWLFQTYGIEGHNFAFQNGVPVGSTTVKDEVIGPFWPQPNPVFFFPGAAEDAVREQEIVEVMWPHAEINPAQSLFTQELSDKGTAIAQVVSDTINGIVTGRKPMSELQAARELWRKSGGDEVRASLEALPPAK